MKFAAEAGVVGAVVTHWLLPVHFVSSVLIPSLPHLAPAQLVVVAAAAGAVPCA